MAQKKPRKLNLTFSIAIALMALGYLVLTSSPDKKPTTPHLGAKSSSVSQASVGSVPVPVKIQASGAATSSVTNSLNVTPAVMGASSSFSIPADLPEDMVRALTNPPPPLPADLAAQLHSPPPELPDDLKKQLESPPPPLPPDMEAQLNGPPPAMPDDIKKALVTPPRLVTIDEVNHRSSISGGTSSIGPE